MTYTRPYAAGFLDYPDVTTPVTAAVLNTMDDGIATANDNYTICTSTTRPAAPYDGQMIYETNTSKNLIYDGTSWIANVTVGDTGTVTSTMILNGTILDADINASAGIVDTKLATIATALKVSNSATTAASANTASAIVARDASGNFTAGVVTATNAVLTGYLQRTAPVSTAVNLTVAATTTWVICTAVAVLTLGTATAGREILVKNTTAATVTSASANVVPLLGGAASTAILAATAGKWATLVGDGTNWIIMQSN